MAQTGFWGTAAPIDPVAWGERLLDIAVKRYKPVAVYGMFSGGHDSLCATHFATQHPAFTAAVHINTGIGVSETREYVRQTAADQGWPLIEIRAKEDCGQDYDELVREHGFPGPFHHRKMYNRLKERAMRRLVRDVKTKVTDRVLLVTGVRKAESVRRMGTVEPINREGARVWCAPLAWFDARHKTEYMEAHGLPRNEVVDQLHMSGECLCGAFAKPGELEWLEFCGYTEVVARIRRLEDEARGIGVPCVWGKAPSNEPTHDSAPGFLCVGCTQAQPQHLEPDRIEMTPDHILADLLDEKLLPAGEDDEY
jgi:3'-phosphoadenosine 5'-phosphosulfate sulfotransferase (PAPS reductase)/FAD synthetase